ncbi:Putative uncharacterized protein [Lacticaseibacillus paracasei]|nr:Putative uncharacterized protein [Lacticaseibacillus paracasei]
MVPFFHASR